MDQYKFYLKFLFIGPANCSNNFIRRKAKHKFSQKYFTLDYRIINFDGITLAYVEMSTRKIKIKRRKKKILKQEILNNKIIILF